MNNIIAVIPVKKNSTRLANKNILPFGQSTLLEYKINQLKKIKKISEIIVSSDSEEMLSIARRNGVSIDKRPLEYANESRPFSEFLLYLTTQFKKEHKHMMWACCTSPLVDVKRYEEAIEIYLDKLNKNECDSLITVYEYKHFMLDEKGPMNFKPGPEHVNSQDLPSFDIFTNGIILSPIHSIKRWEYHFGSNPYRLYINQIEAIDIDTEFDYHCALAGYSLVQNKI